MTAGCRGRFSPLGTDGFGRSENRICLRDFFEVDYRYVVVATLGALAREGKLDASVVAAGDPGLQHQSRKERSRKFVTMADFTLPELGENVTAGDVLRVLVKPGDTVAKDQTVLELETDKATIEVPSSVAGRVTAVSVKAGDKVKVGQVVLTVEDGAGKSAEASAAAPEKAEAPEKAPEKSPEKAAEKAPEQASAPAGERGRRRRLEQDARRWARTTGRRPEAGRRGRGTRGGWRKSQDGREGTEGTAARSWTSRRGARPSAEPAAADLPPAPAAPSVRRMARELGVDIDAVSGSGAAGRISIEDVKSHAKRLLEGAARAGAGAPGSAAGGIRCPTSRAGERSSVSPCARCGARQPSTSARRGARFLTSRSTILPT